MGSRRSPIQAVEAFAAARYGAASSVCADHVRAGYVVTIFDAKGLPRAFSGAPLSKPEAIAAILSICSRSVLLSVGVEVPAVRCSCGDGSCAACDDEGWRAA